MLTSSPKASCKRSTEILFWTAIFGRRADARPCLVPCSSHILPMKNNPKLKILILAMLTWSSFHSNAAETGTPAPQTASTPRPAQLLPPYPGCVQIFDGKTWDGWEADPSTWSIADDAMRGVGGTSRLAYTKADYGSFRLIFTARMNPVNGDHLGVLFWGDHPTNSAKPMIDGAGWLQFMPPFGGMWDYHPPKHHNLPHETLAPGSKDSTQWCTTEILCNLEKGTVRAAVDGVEISRYTYPFPTERTDHENGGASEYKDIYLEKDPKQDRLITVK